MLVFFDSSCRHVIRNSKKKMLSGSCQPVSGKTFSEECSQLSGTERRQRRAKAADRRAQCGWWDGRSTWGPTQHSSPTEKVSNFKTPLVLTSVTFARVLFQCIPA